MKEQRPAHAHGICALNHLSIFGITITDCTIGEARTLCETLINTCNGKPSVIYFINTSTLNLAIPDKNYTAILNNADIVFGDGTGVRWAVRLLHNRRLRDNVNGTDLVPLLLRKPGRGGYGYYMLGAEPQAIQSAADNVRSLFPLWRLAGYHHGDISREDNATIVDQINSSGAHLLLVGMGNPIQEKWIHDNRDKLHTPLIIAVGGLFNYWAGNLDRAPLWLRKLGMEWVHILFRQPSKWKRYLIGNGLFLIRVFFERITKRG